MSFDTASIIVKVAVAVGALSFISAIVCIILSLVVPLKRRKPFFIISGIMIGVFVISIITTFFMMNWLYAQVGNTVIE